MINVRKKVQHQQQKRYFKPMNALPSGPGSSGSPGWRFRPQPFTIRVSLEEKDADALSDLGPKGIVGLLRQASEPLNELRSAEVRDKTLFLYGADTRLERRIRHAEVALLELLSLSHTCSILPEHFYVKAIGFDADQNDLKDPKRLLDEWRFDNRSNIQSAFWSYQKLILVFDRVEDALALCRSVVFLSGYWGHVVPYDIRARPRLCWKCGKSGHMRNECMQRKTDCLKCGDRGDHNVWECRSKRKQCLNCQGNHETYSDDCQHHSVVTMFAKCLFYEEMGPSWAAALAQDAAPQYFEEPSSIANGSFGTQGANKRSQLPGESESGPSKQSKVAQGGPMDAFTVHRKETRLNRERCLSDNERARIDLAKAAPTPDSSIALSGQTSSVNTNTYGSFRPFSRAATSSRFSLHTSIPEADPSDDSDTSMA